MVTDKQVRLLMSLLGKGILQVMAVAKGQHERADGAQVGAVWSADVVGAGAAQVADAFRSVWRLYT